MKKKKSKNKKRTKKQRNQIKWLLREKIVKY